MQEKKSSDPYSQDVAGSSRRAQDQENKNRQAKEPSLLDDFDPSSFQQGDDGLPNQNGAFQTSELADQDQSYLPRNLDFILDIGNAYPGAPQLHRYF